jgi:hypothetical protein
MIGTLSDSFAPQVYAAMRNKFGRHALKKIHEEDENVSEREAPWHTMIMTSGSSVAEQQG